MYCSPIKGKEILDDLKLCSILLHLAESLNNSKIKSVIN